jgi:hypothetical protein
VGFFSMTFLMYAQKWQNQSKNVPLVTAFCSLSGFRDAKFITRLIKATIDLEMM